MIIGLSGVQNRAESRLNGHFFFLFFFDPSHTWYSFFCPFSVSVSHLLLTVTFGNLINSVLKLTVPSLENQNLTKVLSFLF